MDASTRVLRGPFTLVGWGVAVLWLAVGAFALLRLAEPWNVALAGFAAVAAVATGAVARGLVVRIRDTGVSAVGVPEVAWEDVEHVGVRRGLVSVPYVTVRRGRALDDLPLDGIACFRPGGALRLAREVADAGGLGEVRLPELGRRPSGAGRRGLRD